MTATVVVNGKIVQTQLKSAVREHNLHLRNKVEAYLINGIDYADKHSKK